MNETALKTLDTKKQNTVSLRDGKQDEPMIALSLLSGEGFPGLVQRTQMGPRISREMR